MNGHRASGQSGSKSTYQRTAELCESYSRTAGGSSESIAEIKVLDQYKIHTSLSEYYIDRITTGLPATVNYQGKKYPLRITKVVPEVKDRMFDVDLSSPAKCPITYV